MTTIRTFVLALLTLLIAPKPAQATIRYIDICGIISLNQIPSSGVLVEAVRCTDGVVLASQVTQPGIIFNFHLRYEEQDDGKVGGQFQGKLTPIPVFFRASYPGCETLIIPCDEVAAGYEATIEGKLTIYPSLNCQAQLPLIGDFVFHDLNDNGLQEDNEPGVPGVTIHLTYPIAGGGTVAVSTNSDAAGRYSFTGVPANTEVIIQMDSSTFPPGKGFGKCDATFATLFAGNKPFSTADFCLVTSPVVDTDSDGIPDDWETSFGLNPNNSGDADLDSDGDQLTNLQEWEASTDPKDAQSRLTISSVETIGDDVRIRFQAKRWKIYQVERINAFKELEQWLPVGIPVTVTGDSGELFVDDVYGAGRTTRYYRLLLLPLL